MEAFQTIQGEGFHQGKAAYFIRLGGCDVGCSWCDVKESWSADSFPLVSIDSIVTGALKFRGRIVVVTGGEPLMYDLRGLTRRLKEKGFKLHLETSGAYPLTGSWDWVCFSPKKFKPPLDTIYQLADELKIVVYNNSDFSWAEEFASNVKPGCKLFLQPEWGKAEIMTPRIVEFIEKNPKWMVSLQIHKFIGVR